MLTLGERAAPSTPASGFVTVYPKSDGLMYWKDDAGTEYAMGGASSGGGGTFSGELSVVASSNDLIVAIKTTAGADPTAGSPVSITFRSATAASGALDSVSVASANSLTIPNGAALGAITNAAFRGWVVAFNDGGTVRIGVINCTLTATTQPCIFPLAAWGIASSTSIGTGSDSAHVFYTGTGVSNTPYTVLGYFVYESGLATPGTFASNPTRVQVFNQDVPLPGRVVQMQRNSTGAVATGTTAIPYDDTPPLIGEGDQYMTQAITPTSAANILDIDVAAHLTHSADVDVQSAIFQDATSQCLTSMVSDLSAVNRIVLHKMRHVMLAATTSATTFRLRAGSGTGSTTTFNGTGGARKHGGTLNSYMIVTEIMG